MPKPKQRLAPRLKQRQKQNPKPRQKDTQKLRQKARSKLKSKERSEKRAKEEAKQKAKGRNQSSRRDVSFFIYCVEKHKALYCAWLVWMSCVRCIQCSKKRQKARSKLKSKERSEKNGVSPVIQSQSCDRRPSQSYGRSQGQGRGGAKSTRQKPTTSWYLFPPGVPENTARGKVPRAF